MKFTKPEARYLAQSAAKFRSVARRHARSLKIALELAAIGAGPMAAIHESADVIDTYCRLAAERMNLARQLEAM